MTEPTGERAPATEREVTTGRWWVCSDCGGRFKGESCAHCAVVAHGEGGRPLLLDLYCCEGGMAKGYAAAGFNVEGVDLFEDYSQTRYPFESHKADAIEFVKEHGHHFDVIHASPPCPHASAGTRALRKQGKEYVRLIEPTREALIATGKPYVIENVRGSALIDPIELCGCMFDLTATDTDGILLHLQRARRFESNMALSAPRPCDHSDHEWVGGSYGGARRDKYEAKHVRHGGYVPSIPVQRELLGIDWMTQKGMHQAIPPAYAEWLGRQIMVHLDRSLVAASGGDDRAVDGGDAGASSANNAQVGQAFPFPSSPQEPQ